MSAEGPVALLVEDERAARLFIPASLASHGFQPMETATASEVTMRRRSGRRAGILMLS